MISQSAPVPNSQKCGGYENMAMTVPLTFRLSLGGFERKACENSQTGVEFCAVTGEPLTQARAAMPFANLLRASIPVRFFVAALTVEFETNARGATFFR